jgi:putative MATE family efflux protein
MLGVDSALCGRLPNAGQALAAMGFALQVVFLMMVAMLGLLVGTVALVARAYGGGDARRVEHLLVQSTQLTAIVGVGVGIVCAVCSEWILLALRAEPDVAEVGARFLRPLMIGTPFIYLAMLYSGVFRAVGNTRIPFVCALAANGVNAILNYGLVLGNLGLPALGVTGSAIGTVIAQLFNLVLLVVYLRRGAIPNLTLPLARRPIDRPLARELFKVGWPAALDTLVLNAGLMTVIGLLGYIDQDAVAAHGLGFRVQALAFVPGMGLGQATAAMVGQALGGGNVDRARAIARAAMRLCLAIMTAIANRDLRRRRTAGPCLRRRPGNAAGVIRRPLHAHPELRDAARGDQPRADRAAPGLGRDQDQSADEHLGDARVPGAARGRARVWLRPRRDRCVAQHAARLLREGGAQPHLVPPGEVGRDRRADQGRSIDRGLVRFTIRHVTRPVINTSPPPMPSSRQRYGVFAGCGDVQNPERPCGSSICTRSGGCAPAGPASAPSASAIESTSLIASSTWVASWSSSSSSADPGRAARAGWSTASS